MWHVLRLDSALLATLSIDGDAEYSEAVKAYKGIFPGETQLKNGFFCTVDEEGMLHRKGIIFHTDAISDGSALEMLIFNEVPEAAIAVVASAIAPPTDKG